MEGEFLDDDDGKSSNLIVADPTPWVLSEQ